MTQDMDAPAGEPVDVRDAARYRWLRDGEWEPFADRWLSAMDIYGKGPEELDAVIDAALSADSQTQVGSAPRSELAAPTGEPALHVRRLRNLVGLLRLERLLIDDEGDQTDWIEEAADWIERAALAAPAGKPER